MERNKRQILTEYLVHQAQAGSSDAFRQLYELWHADLNRFASVKLQNLQASQDVAQESWVQIAKNLKRLQDPACFPRWAFQILSRKSSDWIRKEQRNRRNNDAFESDASNILPQHGNQRKTEEAIDTIQFALKKLDQSEREIIHLFYYSGLSLAEIAEVLSVPKGTVKSRLFKARNHLKTAIDQQL